MLNYYSNYNTFLFNILQWRRTLWIFHLSSNLWREVFRQPLSRSWILKLFTKRKFPTINDDQVQKITWSAVQSVTATIFRSFYETWLIDWLTFDAFLPVVSMWVQTSRIVKNTTWCSCSWRSALIVDFYEAWVRRLETVTSHFRSRIGLQASPLCTEPCCKCDHMMT